MRKFFSSHFGLIGILTVICTSPLRADVTNTLAMFTGILLETAIHETGHAVVAAANGWTIDEFRPYPNMCGGRLVGGCVISHSEKESPINPDGTTNRRYQAQSRAISAAGSLTSQLGVLVFSPIVGITNGAGFWGKALRTMVYFQNIDWIFYTATDSLSNFQGDWYSVSQSLNVPTYYFVAPAAASYWALDIYRKKFIKEPKQTSGVQVSPLFSFLARKSPSLAIQINLAI